MYSLNNALDFTCLLQQQAQPQPQVVNYYGAPPAGTPAPQPVYYAQQPPPVYAAQPALPPGYVQAPPPQQIEYVPQAPPPQWGDVCGKRDGTF